MMLCMHESFFRSPENNHVNTRKNSALQDCLINNQLQLFHLISYRLD